MLPSYDSRLVVLSIVVAICAAYTALSLAGHRKAGGSLRIALLWTGGGAVAMGFSIWSMHFIGMLAMRLPIELIYEPDLTALSLVLAIAISGLTLQTVHAARLTPARLTVGAVGMATGICVMHYVGMAAIRIEPAIDYDPLWVAASVLIALAASFAALLVIRHLRQAHGTQALITRLVAAGAMGLAISGMHYTGMAAAHFAADAVCTAPVDGASALWLATAIAIGAVGLTVAAVLSLLFEAHLRSSTGRLSNSLTEANQMLARVTMQDALTGLPTRSLFTERLEQAVADGRARAERMAVLVINLDRFRAINDSLGLRGGDRLLKAVAERLTACVRQGDTLGRLGGDEFIVLLRGLARPAAASEIACRMQLAFAGGIPIDGRELHVAMSTGIAVFPDDGETAETLLVHAEAAMADAKRQGQGGFQFFAPGMNAFVQKSFEIEDALRRAIPAGELVLHYQPKVSVRSGAVVSFEALVRWQHPVRGLLSPTEFIPVAEQTDLIDPLGEWVLREACRQNAAWQLEGLPPMPVAVNVSARQFQQHDLVARIAAILAETRLAARFLEIELTESAVMADAERSVRMLGALDALGIQVAIDDFGTGYSSLAYLRKLPLRHLKVDRCFIREIAGNADDEAIVRAVVSMAHSLRLQVIAEGVETRAQHDVLHALGCDQFQGYYFSRPLPADAMAALLGRRPDAARIDAAQPDAARIDAPASIRIGEPEAAPIGEPDNTAAAAIPA